MKKPAKECCPDRRSFLKQISTASLVSMQPVTAGGASPVAAAAVSPKPADAVIPFPRVFRGAERSVLGFPLGGVGTGSISLGGRGQLFDWEIFNEPEKGGAIPRYTFPAIRAQAKGREPVTRILEAQLMPPHEYQSGDWFRGAGLPRLKDSVFTGEYPFARIDFVDDVLPVQVQLEAFNPLIPLDPEASSLPLAVLRYRVRNPGRSEAQVSIAWNVDNPTERGGRVNEERETAQLSGLFMHNPELDKRQKGQGGDEHPQRQGSFALCATKDSGDITWIKSWPEQVWTLPIRTFWTDLSEDGHLGPASRYDTGLKYQSKHGYLKVGSVCASKVVPANGEETFTFLMAWHFPNRTPEICGWEAPEGEEKTLIGNHYCERFQDAWDAVDYAGTHLGELEQGSREFLASMKNTTLPPLVLEAAMSNLSTLKTQTVFQTKDGRFHGFEGCKEKGCCPGSCTHVWNYESMLPYLFPTYSRSFLESWLGYGTDERGLMHFRYYLPFGKERFGSAAADGQMGVLMRLYMDWRLTGDMDWLRRIWPKAKKALEFSWIPGGWDEDRDGVMEGCQHNTYDVQFFGPNPLTGILYLGALRACEELARAVGDTSAADEYRRLFRSGSSWIDANLFNGEYYVQKIQGRPLSKIAEGLIVFETDPNLPGATAVRDTNNPINQMGEGCLSDQLFGQELAHVAGLGYLLDRQKIHKTLDSVDRYNFKRDLSEEEGWLHAWALNDESAVILLDYTARQPPDQPLLVQKAILTGIEYMIATHMFYEGKNEKGLELVQAVRQRHDGIRRNPWSETECGFHYSRALASWSCIHALCGFNYHRANAAVTITPRLPGHAMVGFWCVPTGWGNFSHTVSGKTATVELWSRRGTIGCQTLELGALKQAYSSVLARLGSQNVAAELVMDEAGARVKLERFVEVDGDQSLLVRLS